MGDAAAGFASVHTRCTTGTAAVHSVSSSRSTRVLKGEGGRGQKESTGDERQPAIILENNLSGTQPTT